MQKRTLTNVTAQRQLSTLNNKHVLHLSVFIISEYPSPPPPTNKMLCPFISQGQRISTHDGIGGGGGVVTGIGKFSHPTHLHTPHTHPHTPSHTPHTQHIHPHPQPLIISGHYMVVYYRRKMGNNYYADLYSYF